MQSTSTTTVARKLRRVARLAMCMLALVGSSLVGGGANSAVACPGCKEATSEQGANLARGFSYSILFMMPIPFIIVGSFGGYVYYVVRKREREEAGK